MIRWKFRPPGGPIYVLVPLFVLLAVIAAVLLPTDPLIAARLQAVMHPAPPMVYENFNPDDAAKQDPTFGTPLPNVGAGKALRKLPASERGYVVVTLGDCAQCMRFDFDKWQSEASALHVPIVGVSGATEEELAAFRKTSRVTMPLQFDVMDRLQRGLNAYWAGRAYYFDKAWKLQWKMEGFGNPADLNHQPSLKELIEGKG